MLSDIGTLTLSLPPSANAYWRSTCVNCKPRVLKSKAARQYGRYVNDYIAVLGQNRPPLIESGPVALTMKVWRRSRRSDVHNYQKVVLDALEGICWANDRQVTHLLLIGGDEMIDSKDPRVEIEYHPIGESE